ncbi:MAG: ABC transporter permease, partial [Deltaproteobacteria bacterium]|nr:ABC transporter permease [Deltaproteobacteria bacterium]
MNAAVIELSLFDLMTVYALLMLSVVLSQLLEAQQGKQIFWAGLRMFVQLLAVGYILHFIFALNSPLPI